MAADATTAMTIDFLRARLLSERSVSRAAKERADQLARRVAELEEQLLAVTAQRRKAERAAAEVLAILDSQGFVLLSDATDGSGSGSDGEAHTRGPAVAETVRGGGGGNAREDALSGSELGAQASAAQAGRLSWKGRLAGHEWERRRPPPQQQRGRQLRQRQGHGHRRGYLYTRAADSSPKYHPGQSCRKIKRKELRSQREDIAGESAEERSDCTACTDERPELDGELSQDGRGSFTNGRADDGSQRYRMDREKDGDMERVLEKQAELIGQYQAEENAQREWEKKFSESQDSTVGNVNLCNNANKQNQIQNSYGWREPAHIIDKEVSSDQPRSSKNDHFGINKLSEYLPEGSVSGFLPDAATDCTIEECKADKSDHDFGKNAATVASSGGELHVRKDALATKSYLETVEGTSNSLETSTPSPQESCDSSLNERQNNCQGGGNPNNCSSYNVNAPSSERYINTLSVGSPSCDTPKSEFSEWSSSCFHNHTNDQLDTQLYQSSCDDVGGVLEALQRAKMSLREKLSRPGPPSQNLLALPPPENEYTKDDLPVTEMQLSLRRSAPFSQKILELQAPAYYLNRIAPEGDTKVPVCQAGLFRVPTDSFPTDWMASSDGYGSRFSLAGTTQLNTSPSYTVNHIRSTSLFSQYGSGCYPHGSTLLPMPTAGGCRIPESDLRIGDALFLPEIPRPRNNLRKMFSEDALMRFQYSLE